MVFDSVMRFWRDSVSGREGGDIERRPHVIISNLEHDSIAKTARRLEKDGLAGIYSAIHQKSPISIYNHLIIKT